MMSASRLILLLVCLLLTRCASTAPGTPPPKDVPEPPITLENFPRLDASTSAEPILARIACHFTGAPCHWVDWLDGERRLAPDLTAFSGDFPRFNAAARTRLT